MPRQPIFVGRKQELKDLHDAIARPEGQLLLVVGREGSGKSGLLRALHRDLIRDQRRFSLLYRVNENDSSDSSFYRLMGDLLNIRKLTRRKWVFGAPYQPLRLQALLKLLPAGGDSAASLVPEDRRPYREQFLDYLRAAAGRLLEWQRLVLIFDPGERLHDSMEPDWDTILPHLPARVTIIFEQRPGGCLECSLRLRRAGATRVPDPELGVLSPEDHHALVSTVCSAHAAWRAFGPPALADLTSLLWREYAGWVLPLDMALHSLPASPTSLADLIAAAQRMPTDLQELLKRYYDRAVENRATAVHLLHGLAVLARPVTLDRLAQLCGEGVTPAALTAVSRVPHLARCLHLHQDGTTSLFHAALGEFVLHQLSDDARRDLHRRAAGLYQQDLEANQSDHVALDALPQHLYESGDTQAFLDAVDRLGPEKYRLRLLRSYLRDLKWAEALRRPRGEAEAGPLAGILNNLGNVRRDLGDRAGAQAAYEEALAVYRRLAQAEPAAFEPDVAMTLNNLGNVRRDLGDRAGAQAAYQEALASYRRLAQAEPAAFEPDVAMTLNNLGNVLADLGDRAGAQAAYEEALASYRRLAQAEPAAFLERLVIVVGNAVRLCPESGESPGEWPELRAAMELIARLKPHSPPQD